MRTGPAIVIFGAAVRRDGTPSRAMQQRVAAALTLGAQHPNAFYMPTGGRGRHGPAEAAVMAELLRKSDVPAQLIVPEETGTDTLSSVRACKRLLMAMKYRGAVYAATNAYHVPRCVALLRLAGLQAYACPPFAGPASHRFMVRWYWRIREAFALPYDVALGVWLRVSGRM